MTANDIKHYAQVLQDRVTDAEKEVDNETDPQKIQEGFQKVQIAKNIFHARLSTYLDLKNNS